jgi:hypothetical protein
MPSWWDVLFFALGVAFGWFFQWLFSRQASKEFQTEAAKLRKLSTMILQSLEKQGLAELTWKDGEITGFKLGQVTGGVLSFRGELTPVKIGKVDNASHTEESVVKE